MEGREKAAIGGGLTRAGALRAVVGAGLLAGAGTALGGLRTSAAAPSKTQDAEILDVFLVLERVQEAFYREAVRRGRLSGELGEFAQAAARQETEHVRFLAEQLGGRASAPPTTDFADALDDEATFRSTAIELEEAAIGAYIAQGANLTREAVGEVAKLVSVEARQAAWIRDLAGENPAPRAADPPRDPDDSLRRLRDRGFLR